MTENPTFIYAMTPRGDSSFKNFFETGPVMELLENPGELRYAGWDLKTRDRARIVKGEYLEVKSGERKLIRLYEDGSLIVRAGAGADFLGWGRGDAEFGQKPRLNPVAVIEFTYNFANLCGRLVKLLEPIPKAVVLRIDIRNAFLQNSRLYMIP